MFIASDGAYHHLFQIDCPRANCSQEVLDLVSGCRAHNKILAVSDQRILQGGGNAYIHSRAAAFTK
jgi:hypothetical protein